MMEFLYFPDDKSEYIPAVISLAIFISGAVLAMYLFYKKSKKEEQQFNERMKQMSNEHEETPANEQHDKQYRG